MAGQTNVDVGRSLGHNELPTAPVVLAETIAFFDR
jgi:hypothetical protein